MGPYFKILNRVLQSHRLHSSVELILRVFGFIKSNEPKNTNQAAAYLFLVSTNRLRNGRKE